MDGQILAPGGTGLRQAGRAAFPVGEAVEKGHHLMQVALDEIDRYRPGGRARFDQAMKAVDQAVNEQHARPGRGGQGQVAHVGGELRPHRLGATQLAALDGGKIVGPRQGPAAGAAQGIRPGHDSAAPGAVDPARHGVGGGQKALAAGQQGIGSFVDEFVIDDPASVALVEPPNEHLGHPRRPDGEGGAMGHGGSLQGSARLCLKLLLQATYSKAQLAPPHAYTTIAAVGIGRAIWQHSA